ncbi:OmpA family protein [Lutibacter sp. A64]|uniref:OmpA family protein n=1 Tax=Lutibacter sp. A64 TaxID=2918526 RepID=UPI001F052491|nr:OmpA family protein [Lutibacter sp. A64]UMB52880.1 OmpA family protein [Lutibacter sp. A64]
MKKITLLILLFCAGFINAQEVSYSIKNISENTKLADFGVTYYGENEAVFASSRKDKSIRKRNWYYNHQPYLELFKGTIGEEGELIDVERFSEVINTKYHESNVAFTKDLKTVYFSRNNYINKSITKDEEGWVLIQLYKATVGEDGEWTDITPMPFNSDNYQTGHPSLNAEEDKLYFTSDMPGTLGSTDIFVVAINEDGSYGTPQNLGPNVNTSGKEMFPFIDEHNVLYYSSDGYFEGNGGLDVYAVQIEEEGALTASKNLGYPINSVGDDFSFVKKPGQNWGHFSSNRDGGNGDDDIYYFEATESVLPCEQLVAGQVREKQSGALLPGALVTLYDAEGEKLESVIADKFATFSFKVDCETAYKVVGTKESYSEDSEVFTTTDERDLELELGLSLDSNEFVNVDGRLLVKIDPIYFDLDKSFIRPDAAIELAKVVQIMKKYPNIKIASGSHTDSRASDQYNWALSNRRAKSSVEWIISQGIDPSRITGQGYGETQLVNRCSDGVKCSEVEHQLNRRTEFVIVNPEVINQPIEE